MISHPPPHSPEYLDRLYISGKYAEYLEYYRENLEHLRQAYGEAHLFVVKATIILARGLIQNGEFSAAEKEYISVLASEIDDRDDLRDRNASIYLNLAHLYLVMERIEDAEVAVKLAQELLEQMTNPRSGAIAAAKLHSAGIAIQRGDFSEAEPLLTSAVESTLNEFGPKHRKCGVMLDHLSQLYARQGRISEAEATIRRALEAYHAREIPQYAMSLNRLGLLRGEQGDWEEAESCHQKALEILRRVRPPGHRNISEVEARLAYAKQSRDS